MDEQYRAAPQAPIREVNLFDYFYILGKWSRFIVWNVLAVSVVALLIALVLPKWYKSTAVILPPKMDGNSLGALSQLAKDFLPANMLGMGNFGVGGNPAYGYLAILQSRSVMEAVVKKFDLIAVYEIAGGSMEKALKELRGNVLFTIQEEGTLAIDVLDQNPQRAADMANYFVEMLNLLSLKLNTQEAKNNREFIEKRYQQLQQDLQAAEDSLQAFQQQHGIYALPEQTRAAIQAAAELKSQAMVREIELGMMKRSLSPDNAEMQAKAFELAEINKKLTEMNLGRRAGNGLDLFVPLQSIPDIGMQYLRWYRNFEIQNKMLQFIVPLYEQAKIDEQKDVPVVMVLDQAVPAERKDRPKRMFIVLAAFMLALFASVFLVFLLAALRMRHAGANPFENKIVAAANRIARWYRVRT